MVEKAQVRISQNTLTNKKIRVGKKGEKIQCVHCKTRVLDIFRHLEKCYCNPQNAPNITIDWDYVEDFEPIKEFVIKNPCTDKEREFNNILAPFGNPFGPLIEDLLKYTKELPRAHKDAMLNRKLDEIFTKGVEVRLLDKEEYISRLKEKVRKGYRPFLFDPFKPTAEEEIEAHKDEL